MVFCVFVDEDGETGFTLFALGLFDNRGRGHGESDLQRWSGGAGLRTGFWPNIRCSVVLGVDFFFFFLNGWEWCGYRKGEQVVDYVRHVELTHCREL